jgi:hypothetical protein
MQFVVFHNDLLQIHLSLFILTELLHWVNGPIPVYIRSS